MPLGSSGSAGNRQHPGRPGGRAQFGCDGGGRGILVEVGRGGQRDRHLAPAIVGHGDHDRVVQPRLLAQHPLDGRERDLHPARDQHVVAATGDREHAALERAGVGRAEPPSTAIAHEPLGRQSGVAQIALGQARAAEPDLSLDDLHGGGADRHAVVHAAAAGLARAVAAAHPDAGRRSPVEQRPRRGLAADQHGRESGESRRRCGVIEQRGELRGDQRGVPLGQRHPPGRGDEPGAVKCSPSTVTGSVCGGQRAREHVQARDVVRRQGEHPLAGAAQRRLARRRVGQQSVCRQRHPLGPPRRSARLDDQGDALLDGRRQLGLARLAGRDQDRVTAGQRVPQRRENPVSRRDDAQLLHRRRAAVRRSRPLTIRPAHSGRTAAPAGCRARRRRPRRCRLPVPTAWRSRSRRRPEPPR